MPQYTQPTQTPSARLRSMRSRVSALRSAAERGQGERDQLIRVIAEEEVRLSDLAADEQACQEGRVFLLAEVAERQEVAVDVIENLGTTATRMLYGDEFKFHVREPDFGSATTNAVGASKPKKASGQTPSGALKAQIRISSLHDGKPFATPLCDNRGGAMEEMLAAYLRIGVLQWSNYDGPMLLDESFKTMSKDGKIQQVVTLLGQLAQQTGRQILFATHALESFGRIADQVIHVSQDERRISRCRIEHFVPVDDREMLDEDDWAEG